MSPKQGRKKGGESAATRKLWRETPWPWEFEVLTLVIIVGSMVFCMDYEAVNTPAYAFGSDVIETQTTRMSWIIITALAYMGHLLLSRVALRDVSTPFHLIASPITFTILGFFNFRSTYIRAHGPGIWEFPFQAFVIVIMTVAAVSFLLARVRMQRVMLPFRDMHWDIDVAPQKTKSGDWGGLFGRLHPILYPPVRYRVNASGIEIEGPYYVTLISYREIAAIGHRERGNVAGAGVYLTHTMNDLVHIQLKARQEPIVLGPENAQAFTDYATRKLHLFEAEHTVLSQTGH